MDAVYVGQLKELQEHALEAGRAAHMVRSAVIGFVDLHHPVLMTCDNISGQIEGQLRALRAHLCEGHDVKPIVSMCAKSAVFVEQNIEGDFAEFGLSPAAIDALTKARQYIKQLVDCLHIIDSILNNAMIAQSSLLFSKSGGAGVSQPALPQRRVDTAAVATAFSKQADVIIAGGEGVGKHQKLFDLGVGVAMYAHAVQDVCSEALIVHPDGANPVVNTAAAIENEGRTLAALTKAKNLNPKQLQNHLNKVAAHCKTITDFVTPADYILPALRDEVLCGVHNVEACADAYRAAVAA